MSAQIQVARSFSAGNNQRKKNNAEKASPIFFLDRRQRAGKRHDAADASDERK